MFFPVCSPARERIQTGRGGAKVEKLENTWTRWEKLGWQAGHNGKIPCVSIPSISISSLVITVAAVTSGVWKISPFIEETTAGAKLTGNLQILENNSPKSVRFPPLICPLFAGEMKEPVQSCEPHVRLIGYGNGAGDTRRSHGGAPGWCQKCQLQTQNRPEETIFKTGEASGVEILIIFPNFRLRRNCFFLCRERNGNTCICSTLCD